jgi:glycosyltransferase involved in cell wall biosynthesis
MLIPSFAKVGIEDDVAAGKHPRMDYYALRDELKARGAFVDLIDYIGMKSGIGGFRDLYLAWKGKTRASEYDTIFCNSESIALPLGIMLKGRRNRPRVVAIGHRISTSKKRALFTTWRAMDGVDTLFLYSSLQQSIGIDSLGINPRKLKLIQFHADHRFFKPTEDDNQPKAPEGYTHQVCSAGLEWRDYPTLIDVAKRMQSVHFHIAAASPWSKHSDETKQVDLPSNVTVKKHGYESLRDLYQASHLCVTPLYETDFQAGITTILEAMSCGLPVIASKTDGQTDAIVDSVNGKYVAPGNAGELYEKIDRLLKDEEARITLGKDARNWIERHATLDIWTDTIADSI